MQTWVLWICLASSVLPAETLTLEDALKRAVASDSRFALSALDEKIAAQRWGESLGEAIPSLQLGATLTRNAKEIAVGEGASARVVSPLYLPQGNATARAVLFRGSLIPELFASLHEADASHHAQAELQDELLNEIASLYLDVAEAQASMTVRARALTVTEELLALTAAQVRLGMGVQSEIAQAQAERARAQAEQTASLGTMKERSNWLLFRLGMGSDAPLQVVCQDCIAVPSSEQMQSLQARSDLVAVEKLAEAAKMRRLGSWLGFLPEVEAVGNLRLSEPTLFNPEVVWWNAQLTASWAIFSGTQDLARHARRGLEQARAQRASRLAYDEAEVGVRQARLVWQTREAERRAAAANLEAVQSGFARAKIRFREGAVSFFEVTEMARRQAAAEQAAIEAAFAVQRAILAFRRALGLPPVEMQ